MTVSGETVYLKDCYFYLLYKRKGDETPQIPLLLDKTYSALTDTISASFEPTSYFTEKEGALEIQAFACNAVQDFVSADVDLDDIALWTTFVAQISIAKSQLKNSQTIVSEDMFSKGIAEMTAILDSAEEEADDAEEYASDAEEFARGTRSDLQTVPHASSGVHDNAKDYKDLAKDWASKIGGAVESGEYSAKYYAIVSDTRSQEAEAYAIGTKGGTPVPSFADKNAKDWATKTGSTVDGTNYSSKQYALNAKDSADIVAEHATAIDSIYADLTNIDAVATDIQDEDSIINTVAENIQDVNVIAESITDVNDVADDLNDADSNIKTVAANITDVGAVATNISNINDVADNETNINTVAGKATQITTVAGIASNVTTVAGISSDVTAVAGIASDVSAVEDIKTDVSAVAAIDTDVSAVSTIKDDVSAVAAIDDDVTTVATAISDVSTVASDITKVTAVADDLTNIDAVADDLTNIDNAVNYALEAEGWANGTQNGTPVGSGSPYYENNAKYWADSVPDLKSALSATNKRVTNLEQKAGDEIVVDYPSSTYGMDEVPASVAQYAKVTKLRGVSRVENQMIPDAEIHQQVISSDTSWHFTSPDNYNLPLVNGHKYLFIATGTVMPTWGLRENGGSQLQPSVNANNFFDCSETETYGLRYKGDGQSTYDCYIYFKDLTVYFNGTIPSNASTIAQIQQNYPELLIPSDYDTGTRVDTTYSAVKAVGVNIWDEELRNGYYNSSGIFVADNTYLANANIIRVFPSTEYYFKISSFEVFYYDINGNFISKQGTYSNYAVTTPSNCCYINLHYAKSAEETNRQSQICLNSYTEKTTYHPYMENTISLPTPVTLRSAGSVAEEYDLESGEKTNPIGSVDFYDLVWTKSGNDYKATLPILTKHISDTTAVANMVCSKYLVTSQMYFEISNMRMAYFSTDSSESVSKIIVYDTAGYADGDAFRQANNGTILYFELATPNAPTQLTPVLDPFIAVEGGGTIRPIQTQTTQIDSAMSVDYLGV